MRAIFWENGEDVLRLCDPFSGKMVVYFFGPLSGIMARTSFKGYVLGQNEILACVENNHFSGKNSILWLSVFCHMNACWLH